MKYKSEVFLKQANSINGITITKIKLIKIFILIVLYL